MEFCIRIRLKPILGANLLFWEPGWNILPAFCSLATKLGCDYGWWMPGTLAIPPAPPVLWLDHDCLGAWKQTPMKRGNLGLTNHG